MRITAFIEGEDVINNPASSRPRHLGSYEVSLPELWRIKARPPPMREKPAQVHETTLIDLPAMEVYPRKMGSHQPCNHYHNQSHAAASAAIYTSF
jgi:hypothetical protein